MIVDEIQQLRDELVVAKAQLAQAEHAAQVNLDHFHRMANNVPGVVYQFLLRPDGSVAFPYVSDGSREVFGLEPVEVEHDAMALVSLTHPDDMARFQSTVAESAATLAPWRWEGRCILRSGELRWINGVSRPRRLANGDVLWDGLVLDITARKRAEERTRLFEDVVRHMQLGIIVWQLADASRDQSLRLLAFNPAASTLTNTDLGPLLGREFPDIFPQLAGTPIASVYATVARSGQQVSLGEIPYHDPRFGDLVFAVQAFPLPNNCVGVSMEDVTERKRAAEAINQSQLQEEIINAQAAMLAELSTPLLAVADGVVAMPLIGTLDSRRAQQVIEALLGGVAEQRAHAAILDITGVPIVDTQVANVLLRAAQAVQLLGARVVLTGIRPEVAQTLVGLGVNLGALVTRASLQSGIAYAINGAKTKAA